MKKFASNWLKIMASRITCILIFVGGLNALWRSSSEAQELNLLWGLDTPKPPPNELIFITGLAADTANNSYVIGFEGLAPGYRYVTVKYLADGSTAWTQRYLGESGSESRSSAVAVDKAGNVYVTGYSFGDSTYIDYATVSYTAEGQERWVRRYSAPGGSEDMPHDIQVDRDGNVCVTGESHSGGTYDFATVKYDSSGNELWVARYDGPAHGDDKAYRVRFDSSGNVYVGGSSPGVGTNSDYALVKYSPSGQELWVCRYDDPEHLDDFVSGLDVLPDGTAYVTGTCRTNAFIWQNCTTIRVPTTGVIDWSTPVSVYQYSKGMDVAADISGQAFVIVSGWAARSYYGGEFCFSINGANSWAQTYLGYPARIVAAPWGGAYFATEPASVGAVTTQGARGLTNAGSGTPVGIAVGGWKNVFFLSTARLVRFRDDTPDMVVGPPPLTPAEYALAQNYPNPFNPTTSIAYTVGGFRSQASGFSEVRLVVYDLLGREVAVLVNERKAPGTYSVEFDGRNLSSGVYVYRLIAGSHVECRKMVLMK